MSRILLVFLVGVLSMATGCAHMRHRVYVYNGTNEKITETKVLLSNGELLSFGTLGSRIDAGMWPVLGPLGGSTMVEWIDAQENKKSATTEIDNSVRDDSVIFLINSNDTVTVQTGRKLYGPKKSK